MGYKKVINPYDVVSELNEAYKKNPNCGVVLYVSLTTHKEIAITKSITTNIYHVVDMLSANEYQAWTSLLSVYGKYFDLYEIEVEKTNQTMIDHLDI